VLSSNPPEKLSDEPPESFSPNRANTVFLILIEPKKILKKYQTFFIYPIDI
jgi:hypothetical protein